jgi:uncharacterized protein YceH (UPF0502 family)
MAHTALNEPEQRVLGCLIEKRMTTPDHYPLSLNALRLACNQSTNRDPVTHYDEATVREAAQRLCKHGLARLASGHTSRAIKYRHLAEEALGIDGAQLAALAVLLLRGAQTPGELKARTERMARIESLAEVDDVLGALVGHGYVLRLDRRPGQKEDRFVHLLVEKPREEPAGEPGGAPAVHESTSDTAGQGASASATDAAGAGVAAGTPGVGTPTVPGQRHPSTDATAYALAARLAALEAEVSELRSEVAQLRGQVTGPRY